MLHLLRKDSVICGCLNCESKLTPKLYSYKDFKSFVLPVSGKWVPVTTAWRVLKLWMEEQSPVWRIAANILNK